MATTSKQKQQMLLEDFEILKDNWNNKQTLSNMVVKMSKLNVKKTTEMWEYLLNQHSNMIQQKKEYYYLTIRISSELSNKAILSITKNDFIMQNLYNLAIAPWGSYNFIDVVIKKAKWDRVNKLIEMVANNQTKTKNGYKGYKTNLGALLYIIAKHNYTLTFPAVKLLFKWVHKIPSKDEQIKLGIYFSSKYGEYENFEIQKVIEDTCNQTINNSEISKLVVNWIKNIFRKQSNYTQNSFNIVGAYLLLEQLPYGSQIILKEKYKNHKTLSQLIKMSQNFFQTSVQQTLEILNSKITNNIFLWNFNATIEFCNNIIALYNNYQKYRTNIQQQRKNEVGQYPYSTLHSLKFNTRIYNILTTHNITTLPQIVELLDSDTHLEGLGEISIKTIQDKLNELNIKTYTIYEDLDFIFNILNIECSTQYPFRSCDAAKYLGLRFDYFGWALDRLMLNNFLEEQSHFAQQFVDNFSTCNSTPQLLSLLRKDDENIYLPGKYFFVPINKNNPYSNNLNRD
nr:MAG TPA: RNA polymerase-binding protein [Caudoviricetes sp.]